MAFDFSNLSEMIRPAVKAAAAFSAKTPQALARIHAADERYRQRQKEAEEEERKRQEKAALMDAFQFASTPGLDEEKVNEYISGLSEKYPTVDASKVMGAVVSTVNAMDGLQDRRTQRKQRDEAHKIAMTNHANSLEDRAQRILNDEKRMAWAEEDRVNKAADRKHMLSRRGIEDEQKDRMFDANLANKNAMTAKANRAPAGGKISASDRKYAQSQAYKNVFGTLGASGIPIEQDDAGNIVGAVESDEQLREVRRAAESQGLRVIEKANKEADGLFSKGKTTYSFAIVPGSGQGSRGQGGETGGRVAQGERPPLDAFYTAEEPATPQTNTAAATRDPVEIKKALPKDQALRKKFRGLRNDGMSRKEAIAALSAEGTKPRNAQEAIYGRQKSSDSLIDKAQELIGKQQRSEYKKSGEGDLEFFLRKEGIGKTLGERKRRARALKKEFKGMSEPEIVKALSESNNRRVAGAN